jgi:hypothetical protein
MADWTPSAKLPGPALYERFVGSLGSELVAKPSAAPDSVKPFDISCMPPLPPAVRVYLFNCTEHPTERRRGDYRIQLKLPGQRKGERGSLALEPNVFVLLAGYVAEFDVFVLWDAIVHSDFAFSKGVQVAAPAIHRAAIYGIGTQRRRVRPGSGTYIEQVVATRADRLEEGVLQRRRLTQQSLLGQLNPGEDVMIYD